MAAISKKPKVSVVIPTYNRGWILKEAIDSVLNQDFKNFELIVIDDGSADGTGDIIDAYGSEIKAVQQPNKGVSAARNRGIAAAEGQLIAFLDSDDLWLPKKLSRQVDFFDSNPDAVINQTEEIWIRDGMRVNPRKRHRKSAGMIFERSLGLCLISPSAVMIRKTLFDVVGLFDESLPACEDYDLWLRISYRYDVHLIDTPLIIKRGGHADQLSKAPGLDRYRIKAIANLIDGGSLSDSQYKAAVRILQEKCRIYADGCLKRGRNNEAAYYHKLRQKYLSSIEGYRKTDKTSLFENE
jgi:glycosyltransferase involved in cell wall biosynthesis